jgi:ABC-type amino acid transport substrate-binding protein
VGHRHGYEIRRAAVDFSVPYITNDLRLAVVAGDAIMVAAGKAGIGVESIRELCSHKTQ